MSSESENKDAAVKLQEDLHALLLDFMHNAQETGAEDLAPRLAYMALMHEVGFLDGMLCVMGIDLESRMSVRDSMLKIGKTEAYQNHESSECPNCEGAQLLWKELNPH